MKKLINKISFIFSCALALFLISTSTGYAQGYVGKKLFIGYRLGISPWIAMSSSYNAEAMFSHETGIELVKNRKISYGIEHVFATGDKNKEKFTLFNPSIYLRIHNASKGAIAPLGLSNKLGIGIVVLKYQEIESYGSNTITSNLESLGLVLHWSVMKRVPLSNRLLLDYGTGFNYMLLKNEQFARGLLFNFRVGLSFAVK
jgi:hypothetical protein